MFIHYDNDFLGATFVFNYQGFTTVVPIFNELIIPIVSELILLYYFNLDHSCLLLVFFKKHLTKEFQHKSGTLIKVRVFSYLLRNHHLLLPFLSYVKRALSTAIKMDLNDSISKHIS